MLYATCSIFGEENEDQVAAFIESRADARREPIVLTGDHAGGQLLPVGPPAEHNHDGFFYALLQKR
jgi:16S rRNA (cytosine967-C5)-methyltransferase